MSPISVFVSGGPNDRVWLARTIVGFALVRLDGPSISVGSVDAHEDMVELLLWCTEVEARQITADAMKACRATCRRLRDRDIAAFVQFKTREVA